MRGKDIICDLTITAYSADNSGNYVEEITKNFSHFEATWCQAGETSLHARDGIEYYKCTDPDDAYSVAVKSIRKHFGSGHTVEG
jgi:hypothetical protein